MAASNSSAVNPGLRLDTDLVPAAFDGGSPRARSSAASERWDSPVVLFT